MQGYPFIFLGFFVYCHMQSSRQEESRIAKILFSRRMKDTFMITCGIAAACIGLKSFLLPNNFLDGGVTGLSLLSNLLTHINISILIILINIPFILIGAKQVSKGFAIKTSLAILTLSACLALIDFPIITEDKLLIAVFGGFFIGAGIGFAIRGGCVIDGTEVLAIYISRRSILSVGDVIAIFNILLFAASAFFVSLETALYSMLTYISASKTVDFLINGIEEYLGVTIIAEQADSIQTALIEKLGRGLTVYKGESGFGKKGSIDQDRKILFCVVTRLEVQNLLTEIEKIDPNAFVIQHPINDTKGGMIKKRPFQH